MRGGRHALVASRPGGEDQVAKCGALLWATVRAEECERLLGTGHRQHVLPSELFGSRPRTLPYASGRCLPVVGGAPELDLGTEQRPERACISVWHADTARVDYAHPTDGALERHVRMPADDHVGVHPGEKLSKPLLGRLHSHHLLIAARRAMTEQHAPEPV